MLTISSSWQSWHSHDNDIILTLYGHDSDIILTWYYWPWFWHNTDIILTIILVMIYLTFYLWPLMLFDCATLDFAIFLWYNVHYEYAVLFSCCVLFYLFASFSKCSPLFLLFSILIFWHFNVLCASLWFLVVVNVLHKWTLSRVGYTLPLWGN